MLLEMVGGLTGWTVGSFSDDLLASCGELRKCAVRVFPGLLGLRENGTNFQKKKHYTGRGYFQDVSGR